MNSGFWSAGKKGGMHHRLAPSAGCCRIRGTGGAQEPKEGCNWKELNGGMGPVCGLQMSGIDTFSHFFRV